MTVVGYILVFNITKTDNGVSSTMDSPEEYAKIEQTFSLTALTEITNWIVMQTK